MGTVPDGKLTPLEVESIGIFIELGRLVNHLCKVYNILSVAAPVLYIGPRPSHLSELLDALDHEHPCAAVAHGEVDRAVQAIERLRRQPVAVTRQAPARACSLFSKEVLMPRLVEELESR
jgi:hypothetical protein